MNSSSNLKDHRQIGQELDLFSFNELSPGAIFWHPKGWIIYLTLQNFIRKILIDQNYKEISTPVLVKSELFKKSGHWDNYYENIFKFDMEDPVTEKKAKEINEKDFNNVKSELDRVIKMDIGYYSFAAGSSGFDGLRVELRKNLKGEKIIQWFHVINYSLKPMNCPESALVFKTRIRSYNDLPIRYSEFGILHRNELSGVLGGALRVRQFVIDDAHIYVRPDQIQNEIHNLLVLTMDVYKSLNFKPHFYLSTRPDKAMGDKATWDEAEKDLEEALKKAKVKYDIKPKDGAFYGPKIDIHIKDSQDRDWQLATIQLDFQIPLKMNVKYIDSDGKEKTPIIIHRGIFGSLERFIGILTEHFQGAFPVWLSPVQVVIIPITDEQNSYSRKVLNELKENRIRADLDARSETMQAKVREATLQKVPYMVIIGDKEIKSNSVSVRTRDGKNLGSEKLSDFIKRVKESIDKKI